MSNNGPSGSPPFQPNSGQPVGQNSAKPGGQLSPSGQPDGQSGAQPSWHPDNQSKQKKPWFKKWWVWLIALLALAAIGGSLGGGKDTAANSTNSSSSTTTSEEAPSTKSATSTEEAPATASETSTEEAPTDASETSTEEAPATETAPDAGLTGARGNAVRSARNYLEMTGFSKEGLIDQLSSPYGDQYSKADATAAVNSMTDVNWNEQAARKAKSYLEMSPFSCTGLIDQLASQYADKFTRAEATYGAKQTSACS